MSKSTLSNDKRKEELTLRIEAERDQSKSPRTFSIEELASLNAEKLKLFFELEEARREAEFARQLQLVKTEHAINLERIKTEGSARRLRQELSVNLIQAIFKMLFAAGGLGIGALMVLKGHHELGYFMVGVGTSSVAADAPRLIRAIRKD